MLSYRPSILSPSAAFGAFRQLGMDEFLFETFGVRNYQAFIEAAVTGIPPAEGIQLPGLLNVPLPAERIEPLHEMLRAVQEAPVDEREEAIQAIIDFVTDGDISPPEIYVVQRLVDFYDLNKEAIADRLSELETTITPLPASEAWIHQQLGNNCVEALLYSIQLQMGIKSSEAIETLQAYLRGQFYYDALCVVEEEAEDIVVTCLESTAGGTRVRDIPELYTQNGVSVAVQENAALADITDTLAAGKIVILPVDARYLSDKLSDEPEALGHVIQVVSETPDGDFVCLDTGNPDGNPNGALITYSREDVMKAWAWSENKLISTVEPVPESKPEVSADPASGETENAETTGFSLDWGDLGIATPPDLTSREEVSVEATREEAGVVDFSSVEARSTALLYDTTTIDGGIGESSIHIDLHSDTHHHDPFVGQQDSGVDTDVSVDYGVFV